MTPRRRAGTIAQVISRPIHIHPDGRVYEGEDLAHFMGYVGSLEKIETTVVSSRDPVYTTLRFELQVVPTNPEAD